MRTKRELIKKKFDGLCAYSGKELDDKWQIDHSTPKMHPIWLQDKETRLKHGVSFDNVNDIGNLIPCISIINHYKRDRTISQFREFMLTFHLRFAKLPKKTSVKATEKRIKYMKRVAELFEIEVDKPFRGKLYFEN